VIDEEDEYAEWLSELILSYFASQLQSGRSEIYESEIWLLLGHEMPPDMPNRRFWLKQFVGDPEVTNENVIDFTKYKNKLH